MIRRITNAAAKPKTRDASFGANEEFCGQRLTLAAATANL